MADGLSVDVGMSEIDGDGKIRSLGFVVRR